MLAKFRSEHPKTTPGATLRPGPGTPLWNEIVTAAKPFLEKRGEKATLGRILGVPRQRIHEFFVARTAFPDAERTLVILQWLAARRAGQERTQAQ